MSNTAALDIEYGRVIPARFVTKRDGSTMACMTCGNALEMGKAYAAKADAWHSYCERCAGSPEAQVAGLVRRIETLVEPLGDNVPADITALVAQAEPVINQVLGRGMAAPADFLSAKRHLLNIRSAIGAAKAATLPAPVRSNQYGGKCIKCGEYVAPATGRIEKQGAQWKVLHLDGACPTPQAGPAAQNDVAEGLYLFDGGRIAKVYKTRNDRLAVKDLVTISVGTNADGTTKFRGSFQYRAGGMRSVREGVLNGTAHLLSQTEASAFGQQYSICVNCGLDLDDDRSLAAGYGPTCAKNNGWHYPSYEEASIILGRPAGPNTPKTQGAPAQPMAPVVEDERAPDKGVCENCDEDIRMRQMRTATDDFEFLWVDHLGSETCSGDDAHGPHYYHQPLAD